MVDSVTVRSGPPAISIGDLAVDRALTPDVAHAVFDFLMANPVTENPAATTSNTKQTVIDPLAMPVDARAIPVDPLASPTVDALEIDPLDKLKNNPVDSAIQTLLSAGAIALTGLRFNAPKNIEAVAALPIRAPEVVEPTGGFPITQPDSTAQTSSLLDVKNLLKFIPKVTLTPSQPAAPTDAAQVVAPQSVVAKNVDTHQPLDVTFSEDRALEHHADITNHPTEVAAQKSSNTTKEPARQFYNPYADVLSALIASTPAVAPTQQITEVQPSQDVITEPVNSAQTIIATPVVAHNDEHVHMLETAVASALNLVDLTPDTIDHTTPNTVEHAALDAAPSIVVHVTQLEHADHVAHVIDNLAPAVELPIDMVARPIASNEEAHAPAVELQAPTVEVQTPAVEAHAPTVEVQVPTVEMNASKEDASSIKSQIKDAKAPTENVAPTVLAPTHEIEALPKTAHVVALDSTARDTDAPKTTDAIDLTANTVASNSNIEDVKETHSEAKPVATIPERDVTREIAEFVGTVSQTQPHSEIEVSSKSDVTPESPSTDLGLAGPSRAPIQQMRPRDPYDAPSMMVATPPAPKEVAIAREPIKATLVDAHVTVDAAVTLDAKVSADAQIITNLNATPSHTNASVIIAAQVATQTHNATKLAADPSISFDDRTTAPEPSQAPITSLQSESANGQQQMDNPPSDAQRDPSFANNDQRKDNQGDARQLTHFEDIQKAFDQKTLEAVANTQTNDAPNTTASAAHIGGPSLSDLTNVTTTQTSNPNPTLLRTTPSAQSTASTSTAETTRTMDAFANELQHRAIERQVISALRQGKDEIRLTIYPLHLGQVLIRMSLDGQRVRIGLKTTSGEASALLASGEDGLKDALGRDGFVLDGFDVSDQSDEGKDRTPRQTRKSTTDISSNAVEAFSIDMIA